MGYSKEHTAATRARILEAAGRLFRRHGYQATAIDEIMAEAGLTRGGFYAHFRSKEDLFTAVLQEELEFTRQLRRAAGDHPDDPGGGALEAVEYYLNPSHTQKIAGGCTLVATSSDIARASRRTQTAYTEVLKPLVDEFAALADTAPSDARGRGLAALATCIGGVSLARAITDRELAEEMLEACRQRVVRDLGRESQGRTGKTRKHGPRSS